MPVFHSPDTHSPPLHQILWEANRRWADACRDHPFITQLGAGTLDPEAFRRYVAQDSFFLRAFLHAYALGTARCDDLDRARVLHALMGGVLDELKLHRDYAARAKIDLQRVRPYRATRAYADFLLRTAWHGTLGHILAAMTPCMRLYAFLGAQLKPLLHPHHPYRDWIHAYSAGEFESLASQLEALLDSTACDAPDVGDAYAYAMHCEYAFFSAPLEEQP